MHILIQPTHTRQGGFGSYLGTDTLRQMSTAACLVVVGFRRVLEAAYPMI